MPDINAIVFMGRLTKDPQFYPANEDGSEDPKDRCWVVVAHNPPTKHENVEPVYMPINCFGNNARILAKHGKKGKGWGCEGALKTRTTTEADGTVKNYTEIMVRRHIMGADAKNSAPADVPQEQAPSEQVSEQSKSTGEMAAYAAKLVDAGVDPDDVPALVAKRQQKEKSEDSSGDAPF